MGWIKLTEEQRQVRTPEWAEHVTLHDTAELLPMKTAELDVVHIELVHLELDPYGPKGEQPLSWHWRRLSEPVRVLLQEAFDEDVLYRTELSTRRRP